MRVLDSIVLNQYMIGSGRAGATLRARRVAENTSVKPKHAKVRVLDRYHVAALTGELTYRYSMRNATTE